MKILKTNHGDLKLPAFLPDATSGFIKGVDSKDLYSVDIDGVVVNTYHALKRNLIGTIAGFNGIHNYMNFNKPIISDSGGFQVMSLIHNNKNLGKIEQDKITFNLDGKKIILTPEKCIQIQLKLNSDIVMCLDDCTKSDVTLKEQEQSVERTISWAKKCKQEFLKLTRGKNKKPLLFAIVQGGDNKELRRHCAKELLRIGFDGYSFGGWPEKNGRLLKDILRFTSRLIPDEFPKYAMGVGRPEDIVKAVNLGYNLFDCVIPTREARHKKMYLFKKEPAKKDVLKQDFYNTIYIKGKNLKDRNPISKHCDCYTCKNYSLSYICNLFKENDSLAIRLATIHNLRFYSKLMELLRK